MKKIFLVMLMGILFSSVTYGDLEKNIRIEEKIHVSNEVESEDNGELFIYKMLYDELKTDYNNLASTIYWAIGTIFTLGLAIVGGNYYLNKKVYDADYKLLKHEVVNEVIDKNEELKKELLESIENKLIAIESNYKNNFEKNLELYDERFIQYKENIEFLKNEIDVNFNKVELDLKEQSNNLLEKIYQTEKKSYENHIEALIMIDVAEAASWKDKSLNGNVIHAYVRAILKAVDNNISSRIELNLNEVVKTLHKMKTMNTWVNKDLTEMINKLPDEYEMYSTSIKKLMSDIAVE